MHLLVCEYNYQNDATFTDTLFYFRKSDKYLLLSIQKSNKTTRFFNLQYLAWVLDVRMGAWRE